MDTNKIINKWQQIKPYLQQEYTIKTVGLFGSFTDNNYTYNSDMGIMVELERPIGWLFSTLEKYLEKTFNRRIDLVSVNALREQFKPFILSQRQYI